jgi:hypothetical protein
MQISDDYTTLTDIGRPWGLTSQDVGNHLKKHGYRDEGKPTGKAINDGLARLVERNGFPDYVWSRAAVEAVFKSMRLTPRKPLPNPDRLVLVKPLVF